jgi:hypothetical protein
MLAEVSRRGLPAWPVTSIIGRSEVLLDGTERGVRVLAGSQPDADAGGGVRDDRMRGLVQAGRLDAEDVDRRQCPQSPLQLSSTEQAQAVNRPCLGVDGLLTDLAGWCADGHRVLG